MDHLGSERFVISYVHLRLAHLLVLLIERFGMVKAFVFKELRLLVKAVGGDGFHVVVVNNLQGRRGQIGVVGVADGFHVGVDIHLVLDRVHGPFPVHLGRELGSCLAVICIGCRLPQQVILSADCKQSRVSFVSMLLSAQWTLGFLRLQLVVDEDCGLGLRFVAFVALHLLLQDVRLNKVRLCLMRIKPIRVAALRDTFFEAVACLNNIAGGVVLALVLDPG